MTAMNSHTAGTSMLLPLSAANTGGAHILLYALNPGAFTDLAVDARTATGLEDDVVIDGHLPPPTPFAAHRSLEAVADRSTINQALGLLIGEGYPPARAQTELTRRAAAAGVSPPPRSPCRSCRPPIDLTPIPRRRAAALSAIPWCRRLCSVEDSVFRESDGCEVRQPKYVGAHARLTGEPAQPGDKTRGRTT